MIDVCVYIFKTLFVFEETSSRIRKKNTRQKMKTARLRREATEKYRQRHLNAAKKDILQRNPNLSYEEWQKLSRYAHLKPMKRAEWTRVVLDGSLGRGEGEEEENEKAKGRADRDESERCGSDDSAIEMRSSLSTSLSSLRSDVNERTNTEENLRLFCSEIKTFDRFNRAWRDFETKEDKRETMLKFVFESDERGECIAETLFKAKCIETWMLEEMLRILLSSLGEEEEAPRDWKTKAAASLISHLSTPLQAQMLSKRTREKLRRRGLG